MGLEVVEVSFVVGLSVPLPARRRARDRRGRRARDHLGRIGSHVSSLSLSLKVPKERTLEPELTRASVDLTLGERWTPHLIFELDSQELVSGVWEGNSLLVPNDQMCG